MGRKPKERSNKCHLMSSSLFTLLFICPSSNACGALSAGDGRMNESRPAKELSQCCESRVGGRLLSTAAWEKQSMSIPQAVWAHFLYDVKRLSFQSKLLVRSQHYVTEIVFELNYSECQKKGLPTYPPF